MTRRLTLPPGKRRAQENKIDELARRLKEEHGFDAETIGETIDATIDLVGAVVLRVVGLPKDAAVKIADVIGDEVGDGATALLRRLRRPISELLHEAAEALDKGDIDRSNRLIKRAQRRAQKERDREAAKAAKEARKEERQDT